MSRTRILDSVKPVLLGLMGLLAVVAGPTLNAQETTPKFTQAQKIGYLGKTSRSAMVRNILDRLKSPGVVEVTCPADRVVCWHGILLDTIAIDHTPDPDTDQVGFENGGPTRTSRALAMTQIAVFDAVNAFDLNFTPYNSIEAVADGASLDAAIASASFTVQSSLYPAQIDRLTALLNSDIEQIDADPASIDAGRLVGVDAANAILNLRVADGSDHAEPNWGQGGALADGLTAASGFPVNSGRTEAFEWESDPLTPPISGDFNLALGAFWGAVTPFSLSSGDQFRSVHPPTPGSEEYFDGYTLVQTLGASADTEGSLSNPQSRFIGNFWGYDATPLLGAPPRAYNQIAILLATNAGLDSTPVEMARYLAMVNVGLADSAIACWDSKYYYNYWRPVTGIRTPDGVFETIENPDWKPVGISVINTQLAITPTPPFPAYPSGHSTFGASTFEIIRQFFGNETRFTFISDEYNGEGLDPLGVPRPLVPVRFQTLNQAQELNGLSRIYNGVHWQWDDTAGQDMGENIGRHVVFEGGAFQPVDNFLLGDCNLDGTVNFLDIMPFVSALASGIFVVEADCNQDGVVNLLDITAFLSILQ